MDTTHNEALIRRYWNNRAEKFKDSPVATTNDVCLRKLETKEMIKTIRKLNLPAGALILDVGCGDGRSTLMIANQFPELFFVGIDYCDKMIKNAQARMVTKYPLSRNISFKVESILDPSPTNTYSVVISSRCLINLISSSEQKKALANIAKCLVDNGTYIGIENFIKENHNLNRLRNFFGLEAIPIRWHNRFFDEDIFLNDISKYFHNVKLNDFLSSYYILTRVIYSKLCNMFGGKPSYSHWMHKIGMLLPSRGRFCPVRLITANRRHR